MIGGDNSPLEILDEDQATKDKIAQRLQAHHDAVTAPIDEKAIQQRLDQERKEKAARAFRRPRWRTRHVIAWIAFRDPDAINLDFMEEIPLRSPDSEPGEKPKPEWTRVRDWKPGNSLLHLLRSGKLTAFGRDGQAIPAIKWEFVADDWDRNDHEKWERLRFEREQVLDVIPAPVKRAVPTVEELASYMVDFHGAAQAEGRPSGRRKMKPAAEEHFDVTSIPIRLWDDAFRLSEIENKGGAPVKRRKKI